MVLYATNITGGPHPVVNLEVSGCGNPWGFPGFFLFADFNPFFFQGHPAFAEKVEFTVELLIGNIMGYMVYPE